MPKYAGIENNIIKIVSNNIFTHSSYNIIELPKHLQDIDASIIIENYKYKDGHFINKNDIKTSKKLKVAFITNWKMKCGIASYSEALYGELIKLIGDYKFFIEENESPTEDINLLDGQVLPTDKFVYCWKRGQETSKLANAIKEYNPDIVLIQHEFGLFPNARVWLSLLTQLSSFRVITVMHSVFHHKDKTICEAAMPEIIVHLDGAKKVLQDDKNIQGKVYVVHHGCSELKSSPRLWNYYGSNKTFMQAGFAFRYKGYENSIKATAILKDKYPDIFFTGILSYSPFNKIEHEHYFNDLFELSNSLGLHNNVALIKGYQSEKVLGTYYGTNKIVVFPYVGSDEFEVFGASGAARTAMTYGLPIITSGIPHFSDLPTIKASSPEEIAENLDKLFNNNKIYKEQVEKQNQYLEINSWKNIAAQYAEIFEKTRD